MPWAWLLALLALLGVGRVTVLCFFASLPNQGYTKYYPGIAGTGSEKDSVEWTMDPQNNNNNNKTIKQQGVDDLSTTESYTVGTRETKNSTGLICSWTNEGVSHRATDTPFDDGFLRPVVRY